VLAVAAIFVAVALVPVLIPVLVPALFPVRLPPLAPPEQKGELVVMVRPGPVAYFPGPDGTTLGIDAELARRFAAELHVPVRFVTAASTAELMSAVAHGRAHLGAGGLLRPAHPAPAVALPKSHAYPLAASTAADDPAARVRWSIGYHTVLPVLICNTGGFKPAGWADLEGETVAYPAGSSLEADVTVLTTAHPRVRFRPLDVASPVALFAQVSDGTIGYAIVGSLAAAIARNVYLGYEIAFPVGPSRDVAWVAGPQYAKLLAAFDDFLARMKREGYVARLLERYVPDARDFQLIDASTMLEAAASALPRYKATFRDAQDRTDVEWRLLAAIAYQESKWDPWATSETGVRGLMQITEETARHLGIADRLDPAQSVLGAARYLRDLKAKLPARIQEPDRTWLALAAYNIGLGHLEDARVLAQRQKLNPDLWTDVRKALPLLALPEYFADAKNGYARGGMPVAFVDRVRAYYDILLAHEPALQPRLRMFTDPASEAPAGR